MRSLEELERLWAAGEPDPVDLGQVRLIVCRTAPGVHDQPHLGCALFARRFGADALRWVNGPPGRPRRLRGVNCRVVTGGEVSVGDRVERV